MTDVGQWLAGLGLERYVETFAVNAIGADVLADLSDTDLERLGIPLGDRKRLLKAVAALGKRGQELAEAAWATSAGQAERRQLTVMFCDLVGSTALSARVDPEDLHEVLGAYHRCVADTVRCFDGFVAKYMGDGVLVYFGYPQAQEDNAEQAVRSGLAIIEAVSELDHPAVENIQIRIGISTGPVIVGDLIGNGEAQERGVVGETPNLAARLQALAKPDTLLISASTRRLVGNLFECSNLGAVEVKGFAAPLPVWQVHRESDVESRFEAFHSSVLTPLIGREEEMELLSRRWRSAKSGEGQVVLLSGEPGIGKSRIANTTLEWLDSEREIRLRYFCSPHHQASALHPFIRQLEHAARFDRDDTADSKLGKLTAVLACGLPSDKDVLFLGELIGLRSCSEQLSPQKRKERIFDALLRHIDGVTRHAPAIMLFEDAHWGDPTSLELLSLIINRVAVLPILLVITYRPTFQPPWIGQAHTTALTLNRFGRRLSEELVARVTDSKALPTEVLEQIIEHTDGVPLFIEELTKTVLETGMLQLTDDRYILTGPLPQLEIPSTLHASLMARLDRHPRIKEVAQIGAAIGRDFTYKVLSAVAPIPEKILTEELRALVEAELVFQRGTPPDSSYSFKHALIQDAAYATLLRGKRQQIHASIAQVLESRFPELAETQPELLAHHSTQAGLVIKAVDYWEQAGRRAVNQSANREAVAHFEKALDLLSQLPDDTDRGEHELRLLMAFGPALVTTRPTADPEVDRAYGRARELAHQFGRSAELFPAVWGSWMFAYNAGDFPTARKLVEELFGIAQAEADPEFLLQAHHAVWPLDMAEAELSSARRHIEAGLAIYRREIHGHHALVYGGHDPGVCGYTLDAQILAMLGYLDQAVEKSDSALTLARKLSHPPSLIQALAFAADVHVLRRSPHKVMELADAMLPLAVEYGSPVSVANATMLRGWALSVTGDLERGLPELRTGLTAWRATGSKFHMPYRLGRAADALARAGQTVEAFALVADAITMIELGSERWYEGELHRLKGELLLHRSPAQTEDGEACSLCALRIAQEHKTRLFELRAAASLARIWAEQGRRAEARDLLGPIYAWFTEGLDAPDLVEARELSLGD